jgi:hypothetical protein
VLADHASLVLGLAREFSLWLTSPQLSDVGTFTSGSTPVSCQFVFDIG